MKLSIVTTLYRSAATVNEFYSRAMKAAESVADDIELLIVNDGSPDESLDVALQLQRRDREGFPRRHGQPAVTNLVQSRILSDVSGYYSLRGDVPKEHWVDCVHLALDILPRAGRRGFGINVPANR